MAFLSGDSILPQSILKRFDHVGIAVWNTDDALLVYRDILGGELLRYKLKGTGGVYDFTQLELGRQKLEFIEPVAEMGESFLTKFLRTKGEGMHHLTFQVNNLADATSYLRDKGLRIVDESFQDPIWMTGFVSPRSARGVLIQIYETSRGSEYDQP